MKTHWFNQNRLFALVRFATALLLSCFAAVFISATTPAVASEMVPFNGTVSGYVESQEAVDQCTVHAHVVNFGNANQLGAFTGTAEFYPNFCEDPPNITYTGTFDWFAANGDEISGTFDGYLSPTGTPGVYDNHETAEVTGGTGRFATSQQIRRPLFSPGKASFQVSARRSTRGRTPDLRIATPVRPVAMRKFYRS